MVQIATHHITTDVIDNPCAASAFSDGAGKSGLFSALCDVINRMTYNHTVDVYMAVRHAQTVSPHSVTSLVSQIFFVSLLFLITRKRRGQESFTCGTIGYKLIYHGVYFYFLE